MVQSVMEWVKDIAFYLILMTLVMNLLPNNKYEKYVRLFAGMILIILVLSPVIRFFRQEGTLDFNYLKQSYEQELSEITKKAQTQQDLSKESMMEGYEKQLSFEINKIAEEQGFYVVGMDMDTNLDEENERYLYPEKLKLTLSSANPELIRIQKVDLKDEKEVSKDEQIFALKQAVAKLYRMNPDDIQIAVQE